MKKEYYHAIREVIDLLKKKIEAERTWMYQGEGYALSSARIMNVLKGLIRDVYSLEEDDTKEESLTQIQVNG
ncbi:MAG: hypothetical protein HGA31_05780 [Candidatus Moranbacteria bacterium]|nr:hypothetical protein [Candidatus Moranbacteria bacterium]